MSSETKKYPPVGQCIYCGATEYAPDLSRPLADEHIIPLSLGGRSVLPRSSCQQCERVTGRMESIATNNHLLGARRHLGIKGRTPTSKLPKELTIIAKADGQDRPVKLAVDDCPAFLFLPFFHNPPVLSALKGSTQAPLQGIFTQSLNYRPDVLKTKYGIEEWSAVSLEVPVFCRVLCKIAYSYAVAELGLGSFNPLLKQIIRNPDRKSRDALAFVGGMPRQPPRPSPPNQAIHTMEMAGTELCGVEFYCVAIRLFANLPSPTYMVVVGTAKGQALPPVGPNPGNVDSVHSYLRITVPQD